jgi:predicted AlkP superfamily pyrophosphatase or phosphodiesterase
MTPQRISGSGIGPHSSVDRQSLLVVSFANAEGNSAAAFAFCVRYFASHRRHRHTLTFDRMHRNMSKRFALLALLAIASTGIAPQQRPAPSGNHVVIISLDGFAGWALDDPYLPAPTLRRLAKQGATSRGMRPVNPTVTWPNHTSMVTGVTPARHGVLFNGILMRPPGGQPRTEPWRDKNEMVRARTLYDAVHEKGMTTSQVDWVAILNAPTITWEFPERPDPKGQIARELVETGVISEEDLAAFASKNILYRDHIWTEAALHILRQHRPNLLLFHLLNLDSTQHRYGPRTPAALTTMALLDAQVAKIVQTLEQTGLMARTTLFVVSDHGFKTVKRQIRPNAALAKAGLPTAYVMPEGGTAMVYVTVADPSGAILGRVRQAIEGLEGIDRVVEPAQYAEFGLPMPSANEQMGALFLTAKDGYAFSADSSEPFVVDAPAASLGTHGYISTEPDIRALFIASGRGIKPGVTLDSVNTVDLAPTAARLLGVELKDVDGRVLQEVLAGK